MPIERGQRHDAPQALDTEDLGVDEARDAGARIGAGPVPAVRDGGGAAGDRSASELAYGETAAADDERMAELKRKVGALVDKQHGGDYKKAFAHYDKDKDGGIDSGELSAMLEDAGVGNFITRGTWVKGIIDKLDTDGDREVQWPELESMLTSAA